MRRTKILATIGPASNNEETVLRLLTSGVDSFRLNFSHGTHAEHGKVIQLIRSVATELGRYVPIVGDIQGPKLRIGEVDGVIELKSGQQFEISTQATKGSAQRVSTPFATLPNEVQVGQRILINDGLVELVVTGLEDTIVSTRVIHGRGAVPG